MSAKRTTWEICPNCEGDEGRVVAGEWQDCKYCEGTGGFTKEIDDRQESDSQRQ